MATVVVIGDVGGHAEQLRRALLEVGAHGADLALPDEVIVVQVGDLVDRGPDSTGFLALVDGYLRNRPDRWIQLVGNHDAQYLPDGVPFWPEPVSPDDASMLTSWWEQGRMDVAAAVRTADGEDLLITHAGLTVGCWRELGEPMTAASAARLLNGRPDLIRRGGSLAVDRMAGPLWAEMGWELVEPWMEHHHAGGFVPFGQVHGHSALVRYDDRTWRSPGRVRQRATVDWEARHVRVRVGGRVFTGIDPKHGRYGAPTWRPLVLPGAELLAPVGAAARPTD
ncbi:metallophosphoesterase [Polymorphospora rubra]|uniref:metallophosphoesterase n=1 Tax=Polymorphospora rubra TaxID=338584 RepID=UPI0033D721E2